MKLLLFGGTFDPPHWGHMQLLQNAIAAVQPGLVVVMPTAAPPHKEAHTTPAGVRMAMCACFLPLFPALEVSDMELCRGGKSYTIDTVHALATLHPGAEICLCIGGDMLATFHEWRRYRELLAACTLVAQPREAGEMPALEAAAQRLRAEGGRVVFAKGPVRPLSSTGVRAAVAAGEDYTRLIPPPADAIVRRQGLYL